WVATGVVWKWSNTHPDSKPACSAVLATRVITDQCSSTGMPTRSSVQPWGMKQPKRMARRYPRFGRWAAGGHTSVSAWADTLGPMNVLAAVPVRRLFVAKRRLSSILDAAARAGLGRALAARTATTVETAGADVVPLASVEEVAAWLAGVGWRPMLDRAEGLDAAAHDARVRARSEG